MAQPAPARPSPKAPELGAFPLDHFRECKKEIEGYYRCLKENDFLGPACRDQTREYLDCRMDKGLMKKTEVQNFGIPASTFVPTTLHKKDTRGEYKKAGMEQLSVLWENTYKRKELERDDGYEVDDKGNKIIEAPAPSPPTSSDFPALK